MSEPIPSAAPTEVTEPTVALESEKNENISTVKPTMDPTTATAASSAPAASKIPTPATSVTGIPVSKLKAPSNFGSNNSVSKIGRPCCTHTSPKAGPPPRDTNSMSRESDDNLSSINSTYTDLYQETVKRFTRSSLSPTSDWERASPARRSLKSNATASSGPKSLDYERGASYDNYLEATGRRRSSDHGAVLTADTEQFIIGHRVWVGGIRPGQIAYIGETHFAPGEWAGIVLDEPNGKNDGCVAGKRYFQCEPKRGIFSRLTRLTLTPLAGAHTPTSPLPKFSPERSRTVSPTASIRSSLLRSPSANGKNGLTVGDRVIVSSGFGSRPGILRYLGETQFAPGNWCGVELDEASGKNDGAVDGVRYFECKQKYGVFVPIAKVSLSPSSKKTRLSRTGSRESLTSIGTMNSIATTNTSRMRMNAQRKSSVSLKTVSTPKSQFSMQDLLRDKQNHIEQLMIERDLDREDAQNQALQLQKNISELKARIAHLEGKLIEERKKSEELQFSIDEATFCGDELNAQTHIYKEKIHDLEKKITQLVSASPSLQSVPAPETANALEAAQARVDELEAKLAQESQLSEARNAEQIDEEKRLQENVKYLQSQNDMLKMELLEKDESLEKFSLSEVGIENLRRELKLLKEENEKQTGLADSEFQQKLAEKQEQLKLLTDELNTLKSSYAALESEHAHAADEVGVLHIEVKSRDDQLQQLAQQVDELKTQLSVQQADNTALDEMLKTQQSGHAQGQNELAQKASELNSLKAANEQLEKAKLELEGKLQEIAEQLQRLVGQQGILEQKLKAASTEDAQKAKALADFEAAMNAVKAEVDAKNAENDKLKEELKNLGSASEQAKNNEAALKQEIELKQKTCQDRDEQVSKLQSELEQARNELVGLNKQASERATEQAKQLEEHNAELEELREKLRLRENESSNNANEMSAKIADLAQRTAQQAAEIKRGEETLTATRNKFAELQAQHEQQGATLKTKLESLEATSESLNKLTQELEASKASGKDLEAQLKASDESKAKMQLELGDLGRKHDALVMKCDHLAQQNETLQADVLAAQSSSADVQGTLKKLNEEINAKQKAFVELETQSNVARLSSENEIETLKQSVANAQKDFAELKALHGKTKDELAARNTQIAELEEKTIKQELAISDAMRQQENLQARYESLVGQNESLQKDLTTLRTSSTDSNAELLKLSQDIVAKQKAYEELTEKSSGERAALEGQLQASQQRIETLCSQVETLTQELKSGTEQNVQRLEQLKAAEEQAGAQTLELSDLARKLETLTAQNEKLADEHTKLQTELNATLSGNADLNAKLVSLNEKLANKQKEFDSQTDKHSGERLQLESQLQELNQRLQASQTELENLRAELVTATDANVLQITEFASLKTELSTKARSELEEAKTAEAAERQKLIADYEAKLQSCEQAKQERDEAVRELQTQLKAKQEELLETQTASVKQIEDLEKQLLCHKLDKEKLGVELQQQQNELSAASSNAEHTKAELEAKVELLANELQAKQAALLSASSESEQLKLQQTNTSGEQAKLQETIKELEEKLEITRTEVAHRVQVAREDAQKMADLRTLLETVKQSNASISATNAELSTALEVLEAEKCETAHIFEIFEMETDRNSDHLFAKLTGMKRELAETQRALAERESSGLEMRTKLAELEQANVELQQALKEQEKLLAAGKEFDAQLVEYKKVIDEMDDAATEKSTKFEALQKRVQDLEQELTQAYEVQQTTKLECKNLVRKLESVELEKTREIVALQTRMNGAAAQVAGGGDGVELGDTETTLAQINFLNSIIADMQKKNDTLKAKIDALEALPTDFTKPNAFDIITKRKPAPRVFCDICDEFDKHETEDCPLQASDDRDYSPPPFNRSAGSEEANNNDEPKVRKLPPPRKYCESCEVFGHETGECEDETY